MQYFPEVQQHSFSNSLASTWNVIWHTYVCSIFCCVPRRVTFWQWSNVLHSHWRHCEPNYYKYIIAITNYKMKPPSLHRSSVDKETRSAPNRWFMLLLRQLTEFVGSKQSTGSTCEWMSYGGVYNQIFDKGVNLLHHKSWNRRFIWLVKRVSLPILVKDSKNSLQLANKRLFACLHLTAPIAQAQSLNGWSQILFLFSSVRWALIRGWTEKQTRWEAFATAWECYFYIWKS